MYAKLKLGLVEVITEEVDDCEFIVGVWKGYVTCGSGCKVKGFKNGHYKYRLMGMLQDNTHPLRPEFDSDRTRGPQVQNSEIFNVFCTYGCWALQQQQEKTFK